MKSRSRFAGAALTTVGAAIAAIGFVWAAAYFYRAVSVLHEADRSWLFWGLGVLFAGLALMRVGLRAAIRGRQWMQSSRENDTTTPPQD